MALIVGKITPSSVITPKPITETPVTLRHIAEQAGVSIGTVSLALRHQPSIPASTRSRIQKIAKKLGYRPDPFVSTLMARVHSRRSRSESPVFALIQESETSASLPSVSFYRDLFSGVSERAHALGYELEPFLLDSDKKSGRQLHRILTHRGIRGMVLAPVFRPGGQLSLPLDGLAACALGYSIHKPALHRIGTHYGQAIALAWTKARERGYQRPGFIHSRFQLRRTNHELLEAYLSLQSQEPEAGGIPPLIFETAPEISLASCADDFSRWFSLHRPDVLLFPPLIFLEELKKRIQIPREAGVILFDDEPGWARVKQRPEHIGAGAVDLVVAQIHRNESGLPRFPKTLGINSSWVDGFSLPEKAGQPHSASVLVT